MVGSPNLPEDWYSADGLLPKNGYSEDSLDDGCSYDGAEWTRDWQTFWSILITSMLLSLFFVSIKNKKTQLTEDAGLNILLFTLGFSVLTTLNENFGELGTNAALSSAYSFFIQI